MPAPHNSATATRSYNVVGTIRDVSDFITNLDPDKTKLTSMFGKTTITGTKHEWLSDSQRPAMDNAQEEVFEFDTAKAAPRRWLYNYVQQFVTGYNVSDITQAIKKYGVRDEKAYQFLKAGKEIASDLELAIIKNKVATPLAEGVKGKFGGIPYFLDADIAVSAIAANALTIANHGFVTGDAVLVRGGTGTEENKQYFVAVKDANTFFLYETPEGAMQSMVDLNTNAPHSTGTGAVVVSGTGVKVSFQNCIDAAKLKKNAGVLTFDLLNDALQMAWTRGGNPGVAVMSARNKRGCAGFTQGAVRTMASSEHSVSDYLDVIETDFGSLRLEAHRMYSDDVVDILELQYWKLGYLIPFHTENPPRTGTYEQRVITGVASLECTAPSANARIKGLNGKVAPKPVVVEQVTP